MMPRREDLSRGPSLANWRCDAVLKQDLFSRIERGHFEGEGPEGIWVMRDTSVARWWTKPLAYFLERREIAALRALRGFNGVSQLLFARDHVLVRSWIPGEPLQKARPADPAYYRNAFRLLVALHRRGVAHNDLAKEPNWLVTPEGGAAFTDFQLAYVAPRRGPLFRLAGREDLRHLLKHKNHYCPAAITGRERRIMANRSLPSRLWLATGKKVYMFITRRILHWSDREGSGDRHHPRRPAA